MPGTTRLFKIINLDLAEAGADEFAIQDSGVLAPGEKDEQAGLFLLGQREAVSRELRRRNAITLPIIVKGDAVSVRVMQLQGGSGRTTQLRVRQRRPQSAAPGSSSGIVSFSLTHANRVNVTGLIVASRSVENFKVTTAVSGDRCRRRQRFVEHPEEFPDIQRLGQVSARAGRKQTFHLRNGGVGADHDHGDGPGKVVRF
ncbi:MAG: hypothetical protein QOD64_222 [Verrucomicrobiota bacterium]